MSSKVSPMGEAGGAKLQFINSTKQGKLSHQDSTQVRSQVMLEFARRKRQSDVHAKWNNYDDARNGARAEVKGEIGKMRLMPTGLQKWAPRERSKKRFAQANQVVEDRDGDCIEEGLMMSPTKAKAIALIREFSQASSGEESYDKTFSNDSSGGSVDESMPSDVTKVEAEAMRHSVWSIPASLRNSPSAGSMDPFNAASILISPRTQSLIHHYCKLQPLNFVSASNR
jgi:hypothetical protein